MNSKKSDKAKNTWGGKREGAGRPKTSPFVAHEARPELGRRCPMRITLKVRSNVPSLRDPDIYEVFSKAARRARRFGLRIIEFSLVRNAIHLLCEMKDKEELERSFKSLNTTLAIALKKAHKKQTGQTLRGPVFLGRYHMELLDSAEKVKFALKDVLTKEAQLQSVKPFRDPYSSAVAFERWRTLLEREFHAALTEPSPENTSARRKATEITASPQFWLTKHGWQKVTLG